jgi:cell wall-associated NlpC family hydrolase
MAEWVDVQGSMSFLTSFGPLSPARAIQRALHAGAVVCLAAAPAARAADATESRAEMVVQALALLGVPYRWGGTDPTHGLDCSGLVRHVYKTVTSLELPRRSEQMSRVGHKVAREDLRAGDLLFFNTLGHPYSHVALYLGDGRFVHAPGRKSQVRVDVLDQRYWRNRFNGARRIELSRAEVAAIAEPENRAPASQIMRSDDVLGGP